MNRVYHCSIKKTINMLIGLMVGTSVVLLFAVKGTELPSRANVYHLAITVLIVLATLLLLAIFRRIELDNDAITYYDFPFVRRSPTKNILGVGLPEQNWLVATYNAFIYVWYDDPDQTGRDRYLKFRLGMFDEPELARMATDIKKQRPDLKYDARMEEFIRKWTSVPDAGKGLWHFLTKTRR